MSPCALVIEDDAATSYILQQVLTSFGLKVSSAADGVKALEKLRNHYYDIIVLDLLLPRVSGVELLEECRQLDHLKQSPVIILTAHSRMRSEISLRPNDYFLLKPVLMHDLHRIIDQALPNMLFIG